MEWLRISTSTEMVRVQTDDIAFVHADGNYSDLYLINGKHHKMTFKLHFFEDSFGQLRENMFVRVGRSLIVNKNYIYIINLTDQYLTLCNAKMAADVRLNASRDALKDLKELMETEEGGIKP